MINVGGQVCVTDPPPDRPAWRAALPRSSRTNRERFLGNRECFRGDFGGHLAVRRNWRGPLFPYSGPADRTGAQGTIKRLGRGTDWYGGRCPGHGGQRPRGAGGPAADRRHTRHGCPCPPPRKKSPGGLPIDAICPIRTPPSRLKALAWIVHDPGETATRCITLTRRASEDRTGSLLACRIFESRILGGDAPAELARWSDDFALRGNREFSSSRRACSVEAMISGQRVQAESFAPPSKLGGGGDPPRGPPVQSERIAVPPSKLGGDECATSKRASEVNSLPCPRLLFGLARIIRAPGNRDAAHVALAQSASREGRLAALSLQLGLV